MSFASEAGRLLERTFVPAFLAGALVTGGASLEGDLQKAVFLIFSGLVLAALFLALKDWLRAPVLSVLGFAALYVVLAASQLVPLPIEQAQPLPDRDLAVRGLEALGHNPASLPLSLAPEATLAGLLAILAPLCGFCLVAAVRWSRGAALLKWAIPLLCAVSALLGLAQIILGSQSGLYPYRFTNIGSPVGAFANANHQASFLLMGLPFVAALIHDLRRDWEGRDSDVAMAVAAGAAGLVILIGILAAGSVAGYLMLAPVLLLSLAVAFTRRGKTRARALPAISIAALMLAGAIMVVFSSARLPTLGQTSLEDLPTQRTGISRVGAGILEQHWATGTGLGSFEDVYRLHEDPATVSTVYIAHAHNDYLEWMIETGLAGGVLLAVFLGWWAFQFFGVWLGSGMDALALRRAAAIACLVPVLHSVVDYPLRTPAIAVMAAMCLAVMIVPRTRAAPATPVAGADETEALKIVTL